MCLLMASHGLSPVNSSIGTVEDASRALIPVVGIKAVNTHTGVETNTVTRVVMDAGVRRMNSLWLKSACAPEDRDKERPL